MKHALRAALWVLFGLLCLLPLYAMADFSTRKLVGDGRTVMAQLNAALDATPWQYPAETPWRDAIAQKIGRMAADIFAMEAVADLASLMADRGGMLWLGGQFRGVSVTDPRGTRFAYVTGAMATGIASVDLVCAASRAGFLAFYGAGGLSLERRDTQRRRCQGGERGANEQTMEKSHD